MLCGCCCRVYSISLERESLRASFDGEWRTAVGRMEKTVENDHVIGGVDDCMFKLDIHKSSPLNSGI
jgi:hypothetical protein